MLQILMQDGRHAAAGCIRVAKCLFKSSFQITLSFDDISISILYFVVCVCYIGIGKVQTIRPSIRISTSTPVVKMIINILRTRSRFKIPRLSIDRKSGTEYD
jgi:hypothetical protein